MSEEKNPQDGGEQPSVNSASESTDENATSAKETESVDEKIKQVIGEHNLSAPKEESEENSDDDSAHKAEQEDTKDSQEKGKEKEVSEKKEEESGSDDSEKDESNRSGEKDEAAPQPSRLDRRIAKLYLSNKLLQGEEGDLPDPEQVALEIRNYPLEEKTKALHKLLAQQKALRSGGSSEQSEQSGQDDDFVDLSQEDHDALIEAEADRKFAEMQGEIKDHEWQEDLVKTVDEHPELDERKKEYDSKLASAVEKLVFPNGPEGPRGMKTSEAYKLVIDSISAVREENKKESEIEKQQALSGAVNASIGHVDPKTLTWEELAEIQQNDPELYMKMVREGKIPTE